MDSFPIKDSELEETVKLISTACGKLKCGILLRSQALIIYHQLVRCTGGEMKYDPHLIAAACISLSAKANGEDIELDGILMTFFCMLENKRKSTLDDEFKKVKDSFIMIESIILRMIDFDLNHRFAHQYLLHFLFDIHQELKAMNRWHTIYETCMKIVSDFYLTNKCLNYRAEEIAAFAIVGSFYLNGINIDNTTKYFKVWLQNIVRMSKKLDVFQDIFLICEVSAEAEHRTRDLYRQPNRSL